jgi:hypothetical protein
MGLAIPEDGIYKRNDSAPPGNAVIGGVIGNDLKNGIFYEKADFYTWSSNDSYGLAFASPTEINKFICSGYVGGGTETPSGWRPGFATFRVYGSDTNGSSYTLIQSFSSPPVEELVQGGIKFRLTLSTSATYKYFLILSDTSTQVNTDAGYRSIYPGEIQAYDSKEHPAEVNVGVILSEPDVRSEGGYGEDLNISVTLDACSVTLLSTYPDEFITNVSIDECVVTTMVTPTNLNIPVTIVGNTYNDEVIVENEYVVPTGIGDVKFPDFNLDIFGGSYSSIKFPDFSVSGNGTISTIGSCTLKFPDFNVLGFGANSGSIKFPKFLISGTGISGILGLGSIKFPGFKINGNSSTILGIGNIKFPQYKISGSGYNGVIGNCTIKFSNFKIAGFGYPGILGNCTYLFSLEITGTGYIELSGIGNIKFPDFGVFGTGIFPSNTDSVILMHQRDERFIT